MQEHSFDIPLQRIYDEIIENAGVCLFVLRLDLMDPHVSGNKLFKLKYNLQEAKKEDKSSVLTFGGAYSNHIAAAAAAGKRAGLKTIGIIRGDATEPLNSTLQFAAEQGMELHFVSRELYKQKDSPGFLNGVPSLSTAGTFIIPEGGANKNGIKGCMEITDFITVPFDYICCACGTGTSMAGIILSLKKEQKAIGFQVLKGEKYMEAEIKKWLDKFNFRNDNWSISEDYHCGGYAKRNNELIDFMTAFESKNNIPLDFIYTGKMMLGIYDLIQKGRFKKGSTIIAVHTGGLQGNAGFRP